MIQVFHFHLNKGLTLILSALETLYGSQLMLSIHLIIKLSCKPHQCSTTTSLETSPPLCCMIKTPAFLRL